jgi:hypothetical protein
VLLTEDYLSAAGSGFEEPSQIPVGIRLCLVLPGRTRARKRIRYEELKIKKARTHGERAKPVS